MNLEIKYQGKVATADDVEFIKKFIAEIEPIKPIITEYQRHTTWRRFKAGDISRADLIKKTRPIRNAMKRCLKQCMHSEERCVLTLANNLMKRFDDLFTFYRSVKPAPSLI